jgi:hypothetical protein
MFAPVETGVHRVLFSTGVSNAAASVLIASAQLEVAVDASSVSAFQETGVSNLVLTGNCAAASPGTFRDAFVYNCDDSGDTCWYELKHELIVDTQALDDGTSKLEGKLARGNYNYRHISVAANVVGTGVLDCSQNPTPSCYGSGYVEYTLEHDAFGVPVIDFSGTARDFSFGSASIQRSKALASERYITLPVASPDQNLLAQPEITKPEFRGRPLSGSYRLRIYDTPALAWERIEDIQLVLNYRYWSRIIREADAN